MYFIGQKAIRNLGPAKKYFWFTPPYLRIILVCMLKINFWGAFVLFDGIHFHRGHK